MKQLRGIIIGVVVLCLLVGGYFAAVKYKESSNSKANDTPSTPSISLLETTTDKITEVQLQNSNGSFLVKKKDKTFQMISPYGVKTTQDKVDSFVSSFVSIGATKVALEKANDLSVYGLSTPSASLSVTTSDKKITSLALGDKTPTDDGYYLTVGNTGKVYVVDTYVGEYFNKTKNDIADVKIFDFESKDLTELGLYRDSQNIFLSSPIKEGEWMVTSPVNLKANAEVTGKMAEALPKVQMASFVADNVTNFKQYGLDKPYYAISFKSKKQSGRLLIGNPNTSPTDLFAMLEGTKTVFTIDTTELTFLDKTLKESVDTLVFITNIVDLKNMVVEMDGQTINCDISSETGKSENDKFTVNGKDANVKNSKDDNMFKKFYQGVIGIPMDDFDFAGKPEGKSFFTVTYTYKDGKSPIKVEYKKKDANFYYALINGKYTKAIVNKKSFDLEDGPRASYKRLVDLMK